MRCIYVGILNGAGDTISVVTQDEFNGDTIAQVSDIAKDSTKDGFTYSLNGEVLTIEASILTGNVVFATGFVYNCAAGLALDAQVQPVSNDIVIRLNNTTTGASQDMAGLGGSVYTKVMYFTDE